MVKEVISRNKALFPRKYLVKGPGLESPRQEAVDYLEIY